MCLLQAVMAHMFCFYRCNWISIIVFCYFFQCCHLSWCLAIVNLHPVTHCCHFSSCLSLQCPTMYLIQQGDLQMEDLGAIPISVPAQIPLWVVYQALEAPTPTRRARMGAMAYQVWYWIVHHWSLCNMFWMFHVSHWPIDRQLHLWCGNRIRLCSSTV